MQDFRWNATLYKQNAKKGNCAPHSSLSQLTRQEIVGMLDTSRWREFDQTLSARESLACKTKQHMGYFNHIFGGLSCISVHGGHQRGMLYQIRFLESSLRSFFIGYISSSLFSEDLFGYIPGISSTTMQPRNSPGVDA